MYFAYTFHNYNPKPHNTYLCVGGKFCVLGWGEKYDFLEMKMRANWNADEITAI